MNIVDGIGLVKLMGRSTGHITLHATLSSRLLLEIDFHVEGKGDQIEFLYMQEEGALSWLLLKVLVRS